MPALRSAARFLLVAALPALAALAAAEGALKFFLEHPPLIASLPSPVARKVRRLYYSGRNIIQLDPDCAHYDPGFFYKLNPGTFTFTNIEFATQYRVNSLGLRDEEESLRRPDIVVIGDSYAMGWGVEQGESFAKLLQAKTGLKVLNAGVSGYGTPQEMRVLGQLDLSRARWLIVEYSADDAEDNALLAANFPRFPIPSESEYRRQTAEFIKMRPYYPGKHLYYMARMTFPSLRDASGYTPHIPPPLTIPMQAEHFTVALAHGLSSTPRAPSGLRIVVLAAPPFAGFLRALKLQSRASRDLRVRGLITLDLAEKIRREHFFALDDHINAAGHAVIAAELAKIIGTPAL